MPSIIFDNDLKKKFEGIRGKFLSTGLFMNLTRPEALELMIDIMNHLEFMEFADGMKLSTMFDPVFIREILEKRKEKK